MKNKRFLFWRWHDKEKVKVFKENRDKDYLFLRWCIADYYCTKALYEENNFYELKYWQIVREKYWRRIIRKRPRNNEFFSY